MLQIFKESCIMIGLAPLFPRDPHTTYAAVASQKKLKISKPPKEEKKIIKGLQKNLSFNDISLM